MRATSIALLDLHGEGRAPSTRVLDHHRAVFTLAGEHEAMFFFEGDAR